MILAQSLADGQRTDTVEQSVSELSKVIALKTRENSDIETQYQTMGAVESLAQVGPDARNMGFLWLKLKRGR